MTTVGMLLVGLAALLIWSAIYGQNPVEVLRRILQGQPAR